MPSPLRNSRRIRKQPKDSRQKPRHPKVKDGPSRQPRSSSALSRSLPVNTKRKSPRGRVNEFKSKPQIKPQSRKSKAARSPSRYEHKSRNKHKVIAIHTAGEKTTYVRRGAMSPR
jgi:hypothetical protein